ncbi:hypothetical protein [Pseudomonas sp. GM48]|uniref:hypothetical protein n=1 Tax=Pseudomonas sp. GM48 TaxID=1144330 RepID=UPI00027030E9|nr:hypothetical protein [Pseudomonas sp. GM48]EJM59436.1 hypothetical protein PMI28_01790 [Pseudomonas sp. GM48]
MPRERTHLRYQLYKSQARKQASITTARLQNELEQTGAFDIELSRVRFEAIDAQALNAYDQWGDTHFSWHDVTGWKAREPMCFDLAIWFDQELCGLCFANPNQSRLRVKIVRLEGKPANDHPLKRHVATLTLTAVTHFARIIGSEQIEIQEPLEGAITLYQQLGFEFDMEGRLVMLVEYD